MTNIHVWFDFLPFYTMTFLSQDPMVHSGPVSPSSSWLGQRFRLPLFSTAMPVLRSTDQWFYRMSLNWDLSNVFLTMRLTSGISIRKTREVKGHFYHILSGCLLSTRLHHPCWAWSPDRGHVRQGLHITVTLLSPLSTLYSLEGVTTQSPHFRGRLCSTSLRAEYLP